MSKVWPYFDKKGKLDVGYLYPSPSIYLNVYNMQKNGRLVTEGFHDGEIKTQVTKISLKTLILILIFCPLTFNCPI
jgi:hypothetical protein